MMSLPTTSDIAESISSEAPASRDPIATLYSSQQSDTSTTESEDEEYEPSTVGESEEMRAEAILQALLEVDENDDNEDEDDNFSQRGTLESSTGEEEENNDEPGAAGGTGNQQWRLIRLMRGTQFARLFSLDFDDSEEDGDVDGDSYSTRRRRRRQSRDPLCFPKVPSDEGIELMNSGRFGHNEVKTMNIGDRKKLGQTKKLARRILDRELAGEHYPQQRANQRLMAQGMMPSSNADMIIHYNQPVYSGQFSDDGNFFFSANKDYKVRMYDTSNPYKWRYYKTVEYPFGQWTLTDASLSPDNKFLAYTSIRSVVCLATTDPNDEGDPYSLDFAATAGGSGGYRYRLGGFGIWSIRFSGDGRELVAGAQGGTILVYDIESRRTLHRIDGHDEDVNAVCFADSSSPHILYSGSDDATLKVWDTRSMADSREAGAFVGHIEGLTYIDSKMDGRYILSNGKEQSMKLWDLRMVMSTADFATVRSNGPRRQSHFDYRRGSYDEDDWYRHPKDNSLVTYRGHRVLRTLIRCHFSPPGSTNSRYVYSGSEDGKVFVWNMDATLAGIVDVYKATKNSRPFHRGYEMMGWGDDDESHSRWATCVRDASWHPNAPIIVASAWSGYGMSTGTCTVHSWNDGAEADEAEPRMGLRVNKELEVDSSLYEPDAPRMPVGRSAISRTSRNML